MSVQGQILRDEREELGVTSQWTDFGMCLASEMYIDLLKSGTIGLVEN